MAGDNDDDEDGSSSPKMGFLLKVVVPNVLLFLLVFGLSASVDIR